MLNNTDTVFDVIVIGGGPNGLSTSYHLSKRGAKTLLLEQFTFFNQLGSSAGVSRQFRIPYPEPYMVKLVKQSQPYWDELQSLTPVSLRDTVGTLWFGDPSVKSTEGNIAAAEVALDAEKVPYTKLNASEIEKQYPFTALPTDYVGLFQADGASINLAATARVLYDWNAASPLVTMLDQAPATQIVRRDEVFHVTTPLGTFSANKLVIVPGPYANNVFNLLGFHIAATYWNMSSAFYKKTRPNIQYPTWFVFQKPVDDNGNQFYGFPEVPWNYPGYVRVAADFVQQALTAPEQRSLIPNPKELSYTAQWVKQHMTGLESEPRFTSTCLIALSKLPDKELLLDFAPPSVDGYQDIVICATGWTGKFVPLMGKILSDLALDGKTAFNIAPFATGSTYFSTHTPKH